MCIECYLQPEKSSGRLDWFKVCFIAVSTLFLFADSDPHSPVRVWGRPPLEDHPYMYKAGLMIVLLVLPVSWPFLYRWLIKWKWLASKIQLPYDTAWDFFFERRIPVFVLMQLKNGSKIGGYFGPRSYATSFPTEGDIYVETVYSVDEDGVFKEPINDTDGAIIRKDQYDLIEFFKVPRQEG